MEEKTNAKENDLNFIQSLINDEPKAWQLFVTKYEKLIYSCILKIMSKFSSTVPYEEIYEIYGNVMLNLLDNDKHKLKLYDPDKGHSFSSWIGLISINTTYDYLRKIARRPVFDNGNVLYEIADSYTSPYEEVAQNEQIEKLAKYLNKLSQKDKKFMYLFFSLGLSPEKISYLMGISIKTVYSKKHKLRKRIKNTFTNHYFI